MSSQSFDENNDQALAATEKQIKAAKISKYYFGVYKNKDKYQRFLCKSPTNFPTNIVSIKLKQLKSSEAEKESIDYFNEYVKNHYISPGDIVYFIDNQAIHTAIVIEFDIENSKMLFVTSNPYWHPYSRPITSTEEAMLGYPNRNKTSYLAPVIRPSKFIKHTNNSMPHHRVEELIREFTEEKFLDI